MKKLFFLFSFLLTLANFSTAQTIEELFKSLPSNYTPELTLTGKDSLLQFEKYTLPGGDSLDNEEVHVTEKNTDFIQISYWYTTGQNGFIVIEVRKFRKKNGNVILVYSKFGGGQRAYDQHTLLSFDFLSGQLIQNKKLGLPETTPIDNFLKPNLPDSIKSRLKGYSTGYNLYPDPSTSVAYYIKPESKEFDDFIKTEKIIYTWDGNKFKLRQGK